MEVQYIGQTPTLVRIDGVKREIESGQTFEMEEKEGKELTEGPYRNLYIVAGTEPGDKQNPDNNKFPPVIAPSEQKEGEDSDDEKTSDETDIEALIGRIASAQTIDVLNEISTDVANDESLEENEEVIQAIEKRMAELMDLDADGKPKADANKTVEAPKVETPKAEAPKKAKAKKAKKSKK